ALSLMVGNQTESRLIWDSPKFAKVQSEEDQRVFDAAFQQWQFAQRQEVLSPGFDDIYFQVFGITRDCNG
ncbi:MAG: hypothetical protein L6Q94_18260, partial [Calditrichia bacterium]|nr:hypothetical protein [Calditrichia bacterium]